jgi:hypothetical protein
LTPRSGKIVRYRRSDRRLQRPGSGALDYAPGVTLLARESSPCEVCYGQRDERLRGRSGEGSPRGTNNLENLKTRDDLWKVRLIEVDFHRLMFEGEDA